MATPKDDEAGVSTFASGAGKNEHLVDSRVSETGSEPSDVLDPGKDVYDSTGADPVLTKKMALINATIDEIGMTGWHWKLFFLNGFGYAVDSVSDTISTTSEVLSY